MHMGYQQVTEQDYQRVLTDNPRLCASRYHDDGVMVIEYSDPTGWVHAFRRGQDVFVHDTHVRG